MVTPPRLDSSVHSHETRGDKLFGLTPGDRETGEFEELTHRDGRVDRDGLRPLLSWRSWPSSPHP